MTSFFLPYAKQSISNEDIQAVSKALKEEMITRGPLVQEFEQAMVQYCQVPYAVAFNSGTSALMAAYFAANLTSLDQLFSTSNSFIATAGVAIHRGITPVFLDIHPQTGNLDLSHLNQQIEYSLIKGRAFIVPVHFSGLALDMIQLKTNVQHLDVVIIEDAAHALGSLYPSGQKVGSCSFSHMTVFSFHPAKILTTGEGGLVTTADPNLYHRLQLFRNNGIESFNPYLKRPAVRGYYEVHAITGNFNFTSFQAALGLSQLKRLDDGIAKRRQLVRRYRQHLSDIPQLSLLTEEQDAYSAFHLFVVKINFDAYKTTREKVMFLLEKEGIGSQIHYIPLYYHPVFQLDIEKEKESHPNMERYYEQALSLPLYFDLTESDVDFICDKLLSILNSS